MNTIGNYGMYQNNLFDSAVNQSKAKKQEKTSKTGKSDGTKGVQLSEKAKQLLQKLKSMYGDTDFIIANYETEEEAASYLSRGTKAYSVLLEPEVLEQMAADEETEQKYIAMIDDARSQLENMSNQLEEEGVDVKKLGVTIGEDGTLSFFAELERVGEQQKERLEQAKEKKQEEKKLEEKKQKHKMEEKALEEKRQQVRVQANSIEELLEKIKSIDWDKVPEKANEISGSVFDFTV